MSDWSPNHHPRDHNGKFKGSGRGTQASIPRGQRIVSNLRTSLDALRGRGQAPPEKKPGKFEANDGWGIYKNEAEFDAAAGRLDSGTMTPAERKLHELQVRAYQRA